MRIYKHVKSECVLQLCLKMLYPDYSDSNLVLLLCCYTNAIFYNLLLHDAKNEHNNNTLW